MCAPRARRRPLCAAVPSREPCAQGLFVRPAKAKRYTAEEEAAGSIENAMRRHLAHKEVDAEMNTTIYNTLDNDDEHAHIERTSRLRAAGLPSGREVARSTPPDPELKGLELVTVEEDYDGPHLSWPLEMDNVIACLDAFKHGKSLHYKYTMRVLMEFKASLSKLPTLGHLAVPAKGAFTIVGDTHGQLQDLFSIFTINDLPGPDNHYLFNGDFVDRGKYGAEICLSMALFHLLYPEAVHFNRGNHEERSQNETAGFMVEVLGKYRSTTDRARGKRVYDLFEECFDCLPLAHVVDEKIFVVHGGLFDRKGIKLAHIASVNRKREIPLVREHFEDGVFQDMLWSDPRAVKGSQKSDRGAGVFWGPNITANFCKVNNLELIVRSHECVPQGYKFHHGNRVLTLFSASRYMGTYTNKGAILVLRPGMKKNLQQFIAHSMGAVDLKAKAGRTAAQEEEVLTMVVERVVEHKHELMYYFSSVDADRAGRVTKLQWAEAMGNTLKLDLPWMRLASKLVEQERDGSIAYAKFLNRYRIEMTAAVDQSWMPAVVDRVNRKLFSICSDVEKAYKYFDVNSDGRVSYEEFFAALQRLDLGLSEAQSYELMSSIDVDGDAHIDVAEFAERFKPVFTAVDDDLAGSTSTKGLLRAPSLTEMRATRIAEGVATDSKAGAAESEKPVHVDAYTREALRRIGKALFSGTENPHAVFEAMDSDKNGVVSEAEFAAGLKRLGLEFAEGDLKKIMAAVDTNRSGQVNYLEFVGAFHVSDAKPTARGRGALAAVSEGKEAADDSWQQLVVDDIINVLYQYRLELRAIFVMFDVDNSGKVSAEEFRRGMKALENVVGSTLTSAETDALMKALDKDGDGRLSYAEFFDSFRIVDTKTGRGVEPPNAPQHLKPGEALVHDPSEPAVARGGAGGARRGK